MQFTPSHQSNAFTPVLQSILEASGQLFKRRAAEATVPHGVESVLPGLEVTESTWDMWAEAECELVTRQ